MDTVPVLKVTSAWNGSRLLWIPDKERKEGRKERRKKERKEGKKKERKEERKEGRKEVSSITQAKSNTHTHTHTRRGSGRGVVVPLTAFPLKEVWAGGEAACSEWVLWVNVACIMTC